MKQLVKYISLFFAFLFLWAAFVQLNDPDAILWIALYVVAAAASLFFFFDRLHIIAALILFVIYLVEVFIIWPENFEGITIGEGDIVNVERGREALGLLIMAMVMLFYSIRLRMQAKSKV